MNFKKHIIVTVGILLVFTAVSIMEADVVQAKSSGDPYNPRDPNHKHVATNVIKYQKERLYTLRKWRKINGSYHENYGNTRLNYGTISVKSVKNEYSAGVSISFEQLLKGLPVNLSGQYKKTVQTVKGSSIGFSLNSHEYGQIYYGKFFDVYKVKRTETKKCYYCGKKLSKEKVSNGKAYVPLAEYAGEVTPTKAVIFKMKKKKDKKGRWVWKPNQCLNPVIPEHIYD